MRRARGIFAESHELSEMSRPAIGPCLSSNHVENVVYQVLPQDWHCRNDA